MGGSHQARAGAAFRHSGHARAMSLIYWDTMLFIYWFEEHPVHAERIRHILKRMEQRKDELCTSSFALAETLLGPYRKGAHEIVDRVREALRPPFVELLPF